MKKMKKLLDQHRMSLLLIKALVLYFGFTTQMMAQQVVRGKVTDEKNIPLFGVNIIIKGTNKGVNSDIDGQYSITVKNNAILVFNYVGFKTKEVAVTDGSVNVVLKEDTQSLDEVVVTGSFDKRTKLQSSISISTISAKQFDKIAVTSSADLLKNIPGVYVNSSLGEVRNTVYSRGVSVGSNDGASGYYYVSMQEDGLPVTNATFGNYGPDYYLRTDATLGRLDAVRGGTASILGNNAPGGIFNYISKTGGDKFEGEVRAKFGLEGNGKNPFYRTDFNVGGPLSKDKSITYNIGGFYRKSDGANYSGYPMNNGGQIKANIVKKYKSGNVKLFAKYLDDKNGWNEFLPTIGFTNPRFAPGIKSTSSVLVPSVQETFTINDTGKQLHYDSRDKIHSTDKSIGLNWEQDFGKGWKLDNKIRYSDKSSVWNATQIVYPIAVDDVLFYALSGNLFNFGTYSFNDHATGTQIGSVTASPNFVNGNFAGFNYTTNYSNFPGSGIKPNSLFYNPLYYIDNQMKEFIDQFTITKKLKNMSFTGGMFYANSNLDRMAGPFDGVGVSYSQMTSPRPSLTDISFVSSSDGQTYQVTNPNGIAGGAGKSIPIDIIEGKQNQFAVFFGHTWEINSKLNFDWGIRSETVKFSGKNQVATSTTSTTGGVDGNPLTLYDNTGGIINGVYSYSDKKINTVSYSGGLNYKFADNQAVYVRYSKGEKAPDMSQFIGVRDQFATDNLNPIAQKVQQWEAGYKLKSGTTNLFVTPFYSLLSNVPQQSVGQETVDVTTAYLTPVVYNKFRTMGVEIEVNHEFTEKFSVRAVTTLQKAKALEYKTWALGANGAADDAIIDLSGKRTDNSAEVIFRISPSYTSGKFYSSLDFSYMGKRPANVSNTFELPAYNQSNLNLGYNFTKSIQLQANINNIFNQNGVMGWVAPGTIIEAFDRQGFTKAKLDANPNAVYGTASLQPRAYFLSAIYKF